MKRPAFQFYPSDWRSDAGLQSCSIAARGLWFELMCVMHECRPYGHLALNNAALDDAQAARLVGIALPEYRKLLRELERAGVYSRSESGLIYSRRMVRDEQTRHVRASGGELGAEHGQKGKQFGSKGGRPRHDQEHKEPPLDESQTGDKKPPLQPPKEPPPSSSSSSSISRTVATPTGEGDTPIPVDKPKTVSDKANGETPPRLPPKGDVQGIDRLGYWLKERGVISYPAPPNTPEGSNYNDAWTYVEKGLKRYWSEHGKTRGSTH